MLLQIRLSPPNGPPGISWQGVVLAVESDEPQRGFRCYRRWPSAARVVKNPFGVFKTFPPIRNGFRMAPEQFTYGVLGDLVL